MDYETAILHVASRILTAGLPSETYSATNRNRPGNRPVTCSEAVSEAFNLADEVERQYEERRVKDREERERRRASGEEKPCSVRINPPFHD